MARIRAVGDRFFLAMNNAQRRSAVVAFRRIAFWEGLSYLLLIFVAMPLKYLADQPQAVKVVGMVHGVLFVGYVALLLAVAFACKLPWKRVAWSFGASLVPFGTFYQDPWLKSLESQTAEASLAAPEPSAAAGAARR